MPDSPPRGFLKEASSWLASQPPMYKQYNTIRTTYESGALSRSHIRRPPPFAATKMHFPLSSSPFSFSRGKTPEAPFPPPSPLLSSLSPVSFAISLLFLFPPLRNKIAAAHLVNIQCQKDCSRPYNEDKGPFAHSPLPHSPMSPSKYRPSQPFTR